MPLFSLSFYTFHLPAEYPPGHELTEAEAEALSRLRMEMVRERARRKWAELMEEHGDELGFMPEAIVDQFRQHLTETNTRFEFGREKTRQLIGSVEREIEKIAADRAEQFGRKNGWGEGDGRLGELMREFCTLPEVVVEAKRRLRSKVKMGKEIEEELLDADGQDGVDQMASP